MTLDLGDLMYTGDPEAGEVITIPAGESVTKYGITATCPAGGSACVIYITEDGAEYSGGEPTLMAAVTDPDPPVTEPDPATEQRKMVTDATDAAKMAVEALTNMSSDEDVMAAQGLIDAAREALSEVTALSASEVLTLQSSIGAVETSLGTARTNIANYRTHQGQLTTANNAVDAAKMAVEALTNMSSDEDVMAAQGLIDAARAAVTAGTMLTEAEVAMLNGEIGTAENNLGNVKTAIANRQTHDQQYNTAMNAVDAAKMAVAALSGMSSDADVTAAANLIMAADTAIMAGTMLTESEKATLNGMIALVKVNLGGKRTEIANYRLHQTQLTAANMAVDAAKMAVAALSAESTDEDVAAADTLVTAAKKAVSDGTMLTPDEVATLNGTIATAETNLGIVKTQVALRNQRDAARKVAMLHGVASQATVDATDAGKAAEKAVMDAKKYAGMLDVLDVGGDSGMATKNAQMVLDARTAANNAVQDATNAKRRAQAAKTEATALPDGTVGKAALIAALDAAIEAADAKIEEAMKIRDAKADTLGSLASYVQMVEGMDKKKPKMAAATGKMVADQIDTALTTSAQTPAVNSDLSGMGIPEPSGTVGKAVKGPSDAQGMTFAQIVGVTKVMDMRIAVSGSGTGTRVVKAKSVAGMTAADLFSTLPPRATVGTSDGTQITTNVAYKGIAGVLFCAGTDCKVGGTGTDLVAGDKLTGSWYLTDAGDGARTYLAGTGDDAGTYTLEDEDSYVRYGYWLSTAGTVVTINRYADGPDAQSGEVYGVRTSGDDLRDSSATYTGDAVGMSVHKEFDTNGKETSRASGGFMADARLTMKFGGTPRLEGEISNFRGSAVDGNWKVELSAAELSSGEVTAGITNDNDANTNEGTWTATAWGGDGSTERPKGVYGGFDAVFTDGNVAGVYATRKQ